MNEIHEWGVVRGPWRRRKRREECGGIMEEGGRGGGTATEEAEAIQNQMEAEGGRHGDNIIERGRE